MKKIVVQSFYNQKDLKIENNFKVNWLYNEGDLIQKNQILGTYINSNQEKIELISKNDGLILFLNFETIFFNSSDLIYRIKLCNHTFGNLIICNFCESQKIEDSHEYLFSYILQKDQILKLKSSNFNINNYYQPETTICEFETLDEEKIFIFKMPFYGKITSFMQENEIISVKNYDRGILSIKPCYHPQFFIDLCTVCGAKVIIANTNHNTHSMISSNIKIMCENTKKNYVENFKTEIFSKKQLLLILDLDNTLIHAIRTKIEKKLIENEELSEIREIYISEKEKYIVKLRPHLKYFFNKIKNHFKLKIYTMGSRRYAENIRAFLNDILKDLDITIKSEDMVSRDENYDPKFKSISRMVPFCNELVLILDDLYDVWGENDKKNVILTKPYYYFESKDNLDNIKSNFEIENDSDILIPRKVNDCYLFFTSHLIYKIFAIFYQLKDNGKKADVRDIYDTIKENMFKNLKISTTQIVERTTNFDENIYISLIKKYGGEPLKDIDKNTDCLIAKNLKLNTKKIKIAKKYEIPIVHFNWIDYSILYHTLLNWQSFQNKENEFDLKNIEKNLVELNKENVINEENQIIEKICEIFLSHAEKKIKFD